MDLQVLDITLETARLHEAGELRAVGEVLDSACLVRSCWIRHVRLLCKIMVYSRGLVEC